jgi:hypothetical protein
LIARFCREPISKNTDGRAYGGRDRHCHQRRHGRLWLLSYYYVGTFQGVRPSPAESRHQVARIAIAGDDWGLVERHVIQVTQESSFDRDRKRLSAWDYPVVRRCLRTK